MRFWSQVAFTFLSIIGSALAQQCGWQAGGAVCAGGLCCSEHGYCGTTEAYCGPGCQSNCPIPGPPPPPPAPSPPLPPTPLEPIIDSALFDQLLLHRNDPACQSNGFYTYLAFIVAARMFPTFGTTGDMETRTREIAAFLAQTSHETTGGWPTAPDGPYSWGYCFVTEQGAVADYCVPSQEWPCVPGKKYFGRGPIQLSYNYNYGQAGRDLRYDLLTYPELLESDAIVSFQTALWFWMTPQSPKPSCHDVMTGKYVPTPADIAAGRLPGYGLTTNIINGGLECGFGNPGSNPQQEDRIGFYKRYLDVFGLDYGENLDCYYQRPFGFYGSEKESI